MYMWMNVVVALCPAVLFGLAIRALEEHLAEVAPHKALGILFVIAVVTVYMMNAMWITLLLPSDDPMVVRIVGGLFLFGACSKVAYLCADVAWPSKRAPIAV